MKSRTWFPPLSKTRMLIPAEDERREESVGRVIALFLAVFGISQLLQGITSFALRRLVGDDSVLDLWGRLIATVWTVVVCIVWCHSYERRGLETMGIVRRHALSEYVIGLLAGAGLFAAAVGLSIATGSLTVTLPADPLQVGWILLFFAGFVIQGMSEELLCRSFLMVSLSRRVSYRAAVLINAAMFSALHLLNPNLALLPLVNIFLFGILASVLTLRRGSIWMVGALHSAWNFAQGNLFGISVSGLETGPSLWQATPVEGAWHAVIHGGSFGLEGGVAATLVLLVGVFVVCMIPTRKSEMAE